MRNSIGKNLWKVTENLDKSAAIVGSIFALILIFSTEVITFQRLLVGFALLLVCNGYFVIRRCRSSLEISLKSYEKPSVSLVINVLFLILFIYSTLSLILRPEPYIRPVGYFVSIAGATGILALEVLLFPRKITIIKIMLMSLSLRLAPQFIFPELIGIDPYIHRSFTTRILENRYIPEDFSYSKLPIMHLIIALTSLITNLDYKASTMLSISFYQAISLVFVFLFSKSIFNEKAGLLAALLLGVADTHIESGFWVRPITLGLILVSALMYMMLKVKKSFALTSLVFLVCAELILTHTIASLFMALLLFSFWFGFNLYRKVYCDKSYGTPVTLIFSLFFTLAMLGWWMYASGHLTILVEVIKWAFRIERWEPPEIAIVYMKGYELESMTNILGTILYYSFVIIGSLYMMSKGFRSKYGFALALASYLPLAIVFSSAELGVSGFLAARWFPSSQLITVPLAAIGLILVAGSFKKDLTKASVLVTLILVISLFMITKPSANIDNPIYSKNTMIRFAFKESELKARDLIVNTYNGELRVDPYYAVWFEQGIDGKLSVVDLTPELVSGDYTHIEGLIVIREEIVKNPFFIPNGIFKLDYDPRIKLNNPNFNLIYNSGTVSSFLRQHVH